MLIRSDRGYIGHVAHIIRAWFWSTRGVSISACEYVKAMVRLLRAKASADHEPDKPAASDELLSLVIEERCNAA
jgi:hypothetical protein